MPTANFDPTSQLCLKGDPYSDGDSCYRSDSIYSIQSDMYLPRGKALQEECSVLQESHMRVEPAATMRGPDAIVGRITRCSLWENILHQRWW